MDQKGYVPAVPSYNNDPYHQPQEGAYPHPAPPPAYDANPQLYPNIPTTMGDGSAPYLAAGTVPHHQMPVQPTVVHTVYQPQVGPEPTALTCPSCRQPIMTNLDYETTTKTHLSAGLLCILFWPCAFLPYCMDSCKNANHYCPNCGAFIGTYKQ